MNGFQSPLLNYRKSCIPGIVKTSMNELMTFPWQSSINFCLVRLFLLEFSYIFYRFFLLLSCVDFLAFFDCFSSQLVYGILYQSNVYLQSLKSVLCATCCTCGVLCCLQLSCVCVCVIRISWLTPMRTQKKKRSGLILLPHNDVKMNVFFCVRCRFRVGHPI